MSAVHPALGPQKSVVDPAIEITATNMVCAMCSECSSQRYGVRPDAVRNAPELALQDAGRIAARDADPLFDRLGPASAGRATALVDSTDRAELFLYPGEEHLFADSSLPAYDAAAAASLTERVLAFLEAVQADEKVAPSAPE